MLWLYSTNVRIRELNLTDQKTLRVRKNSCEERLYIYTTEVCRLASNLMIVSRILRKVLLPLEIQS